jgi:hypothetical protein
MNILIGYIKSIKYHKNKLIITLIIENLLKIVLTFISFIKLI